jgi:hypothetical protein
MNSKKTQKPGNVFLILACWAFPMTWVASIPRDGQPANAPFLTDGLLKRGEATIKAFAKEFATAPRNLCELKAYAAVTNSDFMGWDGFGQRFDYLRLNRTRWYLRSFGSDGRQNTLLSKQDPLASSIEDYQSFGVTHDYSEKATRFNPAIRLGAFSPQGNWHAEIFTDQISGASRLLVRNRDKHGYFMITDQNTVEEFYWLPDGYRIVFTSNPGMSKDVASATTSRPNALSSASFSKPLVNSAMALPAVRWMRMAICKARWRNSAT